MKTRASAGMNGQELWFLMSAVRGSIPLSLRSKGSTFLGRDKGRKEGDTQKSPPTGSPWSLHIFGSPTSLFLRRDLRKDKISEGKKGKRSLESF